MKVILASLPAAALGGLAGIFMAVYSDWLGGIVGNVLSGLLVGGGSQLIVGVLMACHGVGIGGAESRSSGVRLWGAITGGTYGVSLGPVFGASLGLMLGLFLTQFGRFLTASGWLLISGWSDLGLELFVAGGLLGLYLGPVVGILCWEAGYFLSALQSAGSGS